MIKITRTFKEDNKVIDELALMSFLRLLGKYIFMHPRIKSSHYYVIISEKANVIYLYK